MSPNENELVEYIVNVLEDVAHQDDTEPMETTVLYRNQEFLADNRSTVFLDEEEHEVYPSSEDVQTHTEHDSSEDLLRIIVPMSLSNDDNLLVRTWMAVSMTDLFTRTGCTDLTLGLKAPGDAGYTNLVDGNHETPGRCSKISRTETVTLYRNENFVDDYASMEVFVEDHVASVDSEDFTVEIDSSNSIYFSQFRHERNLLFRTWQRFKNLFACVTK